MKMLLKAVLCMSIPCLASTIYAAQYECKVTKVYKKTLESFGEFELAVVNDSPKGSVNLINAEDGQVLQLGTKSFNKPERKELGFADSLRSYAVQSSDVELAYVLVVDFLTSAQRARPGTLYGYEGELPENESVVGNLEKIADLDCKAR